MQEILQVAGKRAWIMRGRGTLSRRISCIWSTCSPSASALALGAPEC